MTEPRLDPRSLRVRRVELHDRLNYASWGAVAGAVGTAVFAVLALFEPEAGWQAAVALALAALMQGAMAYQIRHRHEVAISGLFVGFVLSLAWRWIYLGNFSGSLGAVIWGTVYCRGMLAAFELADLETEYGPDPHHTPSEI